MKGEYTFFKVTRFSGNEQQRHFRHQHAHKYMKIASIVELRQTNGDR